MYVCICAAVTDRQVEHAARGGCCSIEALGAELGVGLQCGLCRQGVAEIAARIAGGGPAVAELRRHPVAA